ncbi:MAG: hypothetical protein LKM36_10270 [Flavobacteriales bacterium]|nr:hypothetical protein [Flavobacteriales bacterium]MBP9161149.1 hypothetical protein [Flavobacteriales bacterium]MCI1753225.1 hypothetical protein [Flavobacteriales bacterium]
MEQELNAPLNWERPPMLARLCVASFINQGVVFPLYLSGILLAYVMQGMQAEEVRDLVATTYSTWLPPDRLEAMQVYVAALRANGVSLMAIFAVRTLARFVGTLRMWNGNKDGFHIYTSAQLLGMLVPMLVAGPGTLNILGFFLALNWSYLYFTQLKSLR